MTSAQLIAFIEDIITRWNAHIVRQYPNADDLETQTLIDEMTTFAQEHGAPGAEYTTLGVLLAFLYTSLEYGDDTDDVEVTLQ